MNDIVMRCTSYKMLPKISFCLVIFGVICGVQPQFLDCSSVEFCSRLRAHQPTDDKRFTADLGSLAITDHLATIDLTNNEGDNLKLEINSLTGGLFRIRIEEENSSRYRIKDVLDGEPETTEFESVSISPTRITLAETDDSPSKLVIESSPLTISLVVNGLLVASIGERLTMENTDDSQVFAFAVVFPNSSFVYGAHEHTTYLALADTVSSDPYHLRNTDNGGSPVPSTMSVYGAIPSLYGIGQNTAAGVFLQNAGEIWIEITSNGLTSKTGYFMVESGSLDLFLFPGPTQKEIVRQFTKLTGVAHMPQLWTLGFHQSRYWYESQEDVKNVIANMDNGNFPIDVIWLDIEYTDEKRYFTWDPNNFSDPIEMQRNLSSTNRKLVTIIDPHIKVDEDYPVYTGGRDLDLYVKNADGNNYEADCWPGVSSWPDFLNPAARDYIAKWYSYENFPGSTETLAGIWNDMNEPSVFGGDQNTMPSDNSHIGGVSHRDVHNLYGHLHAMATHQGLIERDNGTKRPFVLTRSHFAGTQKHAAIWTGDNVATWEHLRISVTMCLTANINGIVFCGADIGGFSGVPSDELMQRWFQVGAWLPFYRSHTYEQRREPYVFDEDVQSVIRDALQTRYKHIPVWYTLFFEHTRTGDPVIKPLSYNYPDDLNALPIDNQMLVGDNILIRVPEASGEEEVPVYFPGQNQYWYSLQDNTSVYQGPSWQNISIADISTSLPIYYRAGSIISRKDTIRGSTTDTIDDPYTIYVVLDAEDRAEGTLYLDDFVSFKYRDDKEYNYVKFVWESSQLDIQKIDSDAVSDNFEINIEQVIVWSLAEDRKSFDVTSYTATADGRKLSSLKLNPLDKIVLKF